MILAVLILLAGNTAFAESARIAESQQLKERVLVLETDEQYVAAFAMATKRLELNIPPSDSNHDQFVDALSDVVVEAFHAGQSSLADELSRVLVKETQLYLGDRDIGTAAAWLTRGVIARQRDLNASWQSFDESRCILETIGETESSQYAQYLWGLGNWYRWTNAQSSLAYQIAGRDLADEVSHELSRDNADMTAWVGWTQLHTGQHDAARVTLEEARAMFIALGLEDNSTLGTVYACLGDLSLLDGDWPTAENYYRQATKCFQSAWAKRGATSKNTPFEGFQLLAFSQLRQGKNDDAWRSLQRYRAAQVIRASVGSASWRVSHDSEYQSIQRLYDRLIHNRASAQVLKEAPEVKAETWSALTDQLALTAEVSHAETQYAIRHPIPEVNLARLQLHLDDRTAYLGWLDAKVADYLNVSTGPILNVRYMCVVRHAGPIEWRQIYEFKTRTDAHIKQPVRQFNSMMKRAALWRERIDDDPELAEVSKGVYRQIFGRDVFELKNVNRLIAEVACYDEWIQTDATIDPNGHYLSERYAFSYSASAATYVALAESRKRRNESPSVFAVGDPVFSIARTTTPPADSRIDEIMLRSAVNHDSATLDKLPPLPYTGRELDRMQSLFADSRILRGEDASELSVDRMLSKDELRRFDIVHVASHALIDPSPERCAIALSRVGVDGSVSNDGLIDTPEIRMGWKLNAELVTLSACQTAGVGINRGEPIGFAQALFQAGARCVLLSFWKVDDEATSLLMSRFYENVAAYGKKHQPVSYSESLAEAKNWVRHYTDKAGRHPFAHPVYWSGFVLIGDAN